jgi:hypothetical protein
MPDRWGETIDVPLCTLGDLVERHGLPVFAKIDIEGYEDKALAGGEQLAFMGPGWMTSADVIERLDPRREREPIAHDVYARLR